MKPRIWRASLAGALMTLATAAALAQEPAPVPDHPRVNEVNQRLDNQQERVQQGMADGQINARQAARDERHDANIATRESVDEARHGGHLTRGEDRRLNRSLNHNSARIHHQRHAAK